MNEWEWQLLEEKTPLDSLVISGVEVRPGDLVRLRPRAGGDVLDLALAGKIAIIRAHRAGLRRQVARGGGSGRRSRARPGNAPPAGTPLLLQPRGSGAEIGGAMRILIAGIGNIFHGDDAFGVEVANRLSRRVLPPEARVVDFGIRGFDLAYALTGRLRRHDSGGRDVRAAERPARSTPLRSIPMPRAAWTNRVSTWRPTA